MKWFATAPSNIALIKYMGKQDPTHNIPANASLSYTLPNLASFVELELYSGTEDLWEPLDLPGSEIFHLSLSAQQRFLKHLNFLKNHYQYPGHFIVRSCNNFPLGSGLASSASSFAALTKVSLLTLCELTHCDEPSIKQMAELSRHGSGSSCRSFFAPWALWDAKGVSAIELPYSTLIHHAIIISHAEKTVSSREAHHRAITSPLWAERVNRAQTRLEELLFAFKHGRWSAAYQIVWQEFKDMHELFHTASQPFTYMDKTVKQVLSQLEKEWLSRGDGPLITMDAGPNIHLLFRPDQQELSEHIKRELLIDHDVL